MGSKDSAESVSPVQKFARHAKDCGSSEVQIALLTKRLEELSAHLSTHPKDNLSRVGMLRIVSKRKGLLSYLSKANPVSYRTVIAELGLRK